jgi:uncharacterized protein YkwD
MKKNIRNLILFIASALVIVLIGSIGLAASPAKSIEVKAISSSASQVPAQISALAADMNGYEGSVAALINDYRTSSGLNALAFEPTLTYIAKLRSADMMDRNYFSHYTPEGTTVFDLMRENGITSKIRGENLAQAMPASIGSPEAFLDAWKNSASHNENMLRNGYNYIGVGMVDNGDRIVVTTVFTN